jgi:hypothetical protein
MKTSTENSVADSPYRAPGHVSPDGPPSDEAVVLGLTPRTPDAFAAIRPALDAHYDKYEAEYAAMPLHEQPRAFRERSQR